MCSSDLGRCPQSAKEITLTVAGSPICGGQPTIDVQRRDIQIRAVVTGGEPCGAGKSGKLVLHTADQPTNVRATEALVNFADAPGAPSAGPAPLKKG